MKLMVTAYTWIYSGPGMMVQQETHDRYSKRPKFIPDRKLIVTK
jgi:hypothetical protein